MKRVVLVALLAGIAATLALVVVGCGSTKSGSSTSSSSSSGQSSTANRARAEPSNPPRTSAPARHAMAPE